MRSHAAARAISRLPYADGDTEAALVAAAQTGVSVGQLEALVRRAKDVVDSDAANRDAERDFGRRGLHMTRGMEGSVLGPFELDADAGDLLFTAIDSVFASERANGNPVIPRPVDSAECTEISTPTPAQRSPNRNSSRFGTTRVGPKQEHFRFGERGAPTP